MPSIYPDRNLDLRDTQHPDWLAAAQIVPGRHYLAGETVMSGPMFCYAKTSGIFDGENREMFVEY